MNVFHSDDQEQHYLILKPSPYVDDCTFIEKIKTHYDRFYRIKLNCCSIKSKFDRIVLYLEVLKSKGFCFNIICMQETRCLIMTMLVFIIFQVNSICVGKLASEKGGVIL